MIEAAGLTKRFGTTIAVDGLSFVVRPGRVTGFLGPNGAGKSTTLRMVLGLDRPSAGTVTIDGRARMPGVDGLEATRRITAMDAAPKVLILTTFDLDEYVYAALRAGASGFLLMTASARVLADAVRVVAAGEAMLAPTVTRRLIAEFARLRPAPPSVRPAVLTARETEILTLVASGLSNAEIATRLVIAEQTVQTHVGRILTKLGLRDRTQAAIYAYTSGLVEPGI